MKKIAVYGSFLAAFGLSGRGLDRRVAALSPDLGLDRPGVGGAGRFGHRNMIGGYPWRAAPRD